MKKLLLFIPLMLLSCGTIKTITVQEPKETIIEYLDGTQAELFVKANEWLVSTFKDASRKCSTYRKVFNVRST